LIEVYLYVCDCGTQLYSFGCRADTDARVCVRCHRLVDAEPTKFTTDKLWLVGGVEEGEEWKR